MKKRVLNDIIRQNYVIEMSKKQQNDEFEKQIGDMGGESLEGKKLQHMPGQQEKLSQSEEDDMQAFLRRSNQHRVFSDNQEQNVVDFSNAISQGWIPIDKAEMGIRAQFYPEDWEFRVRPATVEAIKNWSSIDEERIDVVNSVFNEIIRTCVSIKSSTGNIPWNRVNSWDRFWFILKVREYTFAHGESKIEFTDTCPECEAELTYVLTPQSLFYEFPDPDIIEKHWNAIERAWYIDPKQYNLDRAAVKLYVPTLEKDDAILNWAIQQAQAKKKVDEVFLRFLPWMLAKAPKDEKVLEKFITECYQTYKMWDTDMFSFMDDVVRNITINPAENLKQVCPHCGEEVVSNVRFPNGIKELFKIAPKYTKFGSR